MPLVQSAGLAAVNEARNKSHRAGLATDLAETGDRRGSNKDLDMTGMDSFMWRAMIKWPDLIAAAEYVLGQWNSVTRFISNTDKREHLWTVRHESVSQPFLLLSDDNPRGSIPRMGNPLALLLVIGMVHAKPGCMEVTFANGQKIDLQRFDPADLISLLPQATHPAHKKLADMVVAVAPMPAPVAAPAK
jgi:hypothetical protein